MLGDEAAGIGLVAHDAQAVPLERILEALDQHRRAGRSEAVAEHDVGLRLVVAPEARGGHRVAIDEDRVAELPGGALDEAAQHPVIGLVEPLDARDRLLDGDAAGIDLLPVGDDARHRAEPARHPHRARVGEGRKPPVEHARIELEGLAVHVEEGPREVRAHQRRAEADDAGEEPLDMRVLGAAQRQRVEPRPVEEGLRIDRPGMARVEHEGQPVALRLVDREGGIEPERVRRIEGRRRHRRLGGCACGSGIPPLWGDRPAVSTGQRSRE